MNSTVRPAPTGKRGRRRRIPPNLFGIPFGIAGVADVWATAASTLGISRAIPDAIDILAAVGWAAIVGLYFSQGRARLAADVRDPVVAPFVALSVIAPILPAVTLSGYAFEAARAVIVGLVALTVLFGAWLTGQWIVGEIDQDKLHPGYLLPTVAGGLVSAYAAAAVDMRALAEALFGWGIVSWLLLGSLIMGRRFIRPPLAPALIPTHAIEVAPPAVAGIAYFEINGGRIDLVATALAGYTAAMALVQLRLVPIYVRLPFSAGFWTFTLPYAALGTLGALWIELKTPAGASAYAVIDVGLITVLVSAILARSFIAIGRDQFLPPVNGEPADDQASATRAPEPRNAAVVK
ncbi:tellurite resistance protein [Catenulispora sp. GAS73]|uniref:SLAC1 family transporter n=1 Tax=Catenulispora sp. GAS73 TaxID=3156269 RepID=UPI0035120F2D